MALSFNPSGAAAPDPVEGEGGPPQAAEVQDAGKPLQRESLPFLIRVAQDAPTLAKAVQIRFAAYNRHVPDLARTLQQPEAVDTQPGVAVLLAESRLDGSPLGTLRIHTNEFRPLPVEQSLELPDAMQGVRLAEATRLGVVNDKIGSLVKTLLFKAFFQYCEASQVEWMVVTGRSPIDRQYERLLFRDVYPGMGFIPLSYVGNLPHRVMCFKLAEALKSPEARQHAWFHFMFGLQHPDIQVLEPDGRPKRFGASSPVGTASTTPSMNRWGQHASSVTA